jgi:hypothetical protein
MRNKMILIVILAMLTQTSVFAQNSFTFLKKSDTLKKSRLRIACITQGSIWSGSLIGLNNAWYANYPRSSFHFFNDMGEWNQVDKIGHAWSAYFGAQLSSEFFQWAGVSRKRAAWYGAGMGISYVSVIEILDGFSKEWGFSVGDMVANTAGATLFAAQEIAWQEQRIALKFSAHKNYYQDQILLNKANTLYGKSLAERILKDYNAQTYWLSANIKSFRTYSNLPSWLNIAVGYGAQGIFGGFTNDWTDKKTGIYYDRTDVKRFRQFYLSPDIDLSKIKIGHRKLRALKFLNTLKLKFPMPTLEINSLGQIKLHPIYF